MGSVAMGQPLGPRIHCENSILCSIKEMLGKEGKLKLQTTENGTSTTSWTNFGCCLCKMFSQKYLTARIPPLSLQWNCNVKCTKDGSIILIWVNREGSNTVQVSSCTSSRVIRCETLQDMNGHDKAPVYSPNVNVNWMNRGKKGVI